MKPLSEEEALVTTVPARSAAPVGKRRRPRKTLSVKAKAAKEKAKPPSEEEKAIAKEKAILARFEVLPDSAAVPLKICSLVSGLSERTWRDNPPIPVFLLSASKRGANVGILRKYLLGESLLIQAQQAGHKERRREKTPPIAETAVA
jgi:hypothetical protein